MTLILISKYLGIHFVINPYEFSYVCNEFLNVWNKINLIWYMHKQN